MAGGDNGYQRRWNTYDKHHLLFNVQCYNKQWIIRVSAVAIWARGLVRSFTSVATLGAGWGAASASCWLSCWLASLSSWDGGDRGGDSGQPPASLHCGKPQSKAWKKDEKLFVSFVVFWKDSGGEHREPGCVHWGGAGGAGGQRVPGWVQREAGAGGGAEGHQQPPQSPGGRLQILHTQTPQVRPSVIRIDLKWNKQYQPNALCLYA